MKEIFITNELSRLENLVTNTKDDVLISSFDQLKEFSEKLSMIKPIIIDLGMVPKMDYYTDLMFKAYSSAANQPILSGGRYDQLLSNFQEEAVAIGFCCHMDTILKALERQNWRKTMIKIAITKGRIQKQVTNLLENANYDVEPILNLGRELQIKTKDDLQIIFGKANDVITF